ncbi:hypothetical protein FJ661_12235 [Pseudarthrobacter phenanthrenivorans]|uniref:hypothetical protein n=1 Tax=Pseudarthrobacter phenanthrenivorans TaxID=361575 RepID=UPI001126F834|nr:hypothetical protein [Pseudarthrobacter phenanthrenivorans]TPV50070.1 hypothetical protein FJ661_12235 [Pseudarthrobacter phenanthrenivorans]
MAQYVNYISMTKRQSEDAFREYLEERGPALERLREALAADGQDPDALLDGSVESLVPLWRWILAHLTVFDAPGGATDPNSVPREQWPSWARHEYEVMHSLSLESLFLLDGLVSYLAGVVQQHAPQARWEIAHHRIKRYHLNKHPVLVSGTGEDHNYLPGLPRVHAYGSLTGVRESPDDTMAEYARRLIERLNQGDQPDDEEMAEDEPLVEVEDLGDDELRGRELEVSLREDIVHEHSRVVGRMIKALKQEDGISRVIREDREVLLIATPDWSTSRMEQWVADYLEENVRD